MRDRVCPPPAYGPRERLRLLGEERLSDAEALALILRTGLAGRSAEQVAQGLLHALGGLEALATAELAELAECPGVGPVRAASLRSAFGLARRLCERRLGPGRRLRRSGEVAELVRESTRGSGREAFYSLLLDARHRVMAMRRVSLGGLQAAPVHPREVFAPALRERAAAIVVAHNHPSGDPLPSAEDRRVTERLRQVAVLVGIELLDHVVVGADSYYSFADQGVAPILSVTRPPSDD